MTPFFKTSIVALGRWTVWRACGGLSAAAFGAVCLAGTTPVASAQQPAAVFEATAADPVGDSTGGRVQDLVTVVARFDRDYGELSATATLAAGDLTGVVKVSFGTLTATGGCDSAQGATVTFNSAVAGAVWQVNGLAPIALDGPPATASMTSVLYGTGSPLAGRSLNCASAQLTTAERPRQVLDSVPAFVLPQIADSPFPPRDSFPGPGAFIGPGPNPPPTAPPVLRLTAPSHQQVGKAVRATVTADRVGPATVTAVIGTGPHRVTQRRLLYISSLRPKHFSVRFNHSQQQALRRRNKGRYHATVRVSAFGAAATRTVQVR